MTLRNLTVAAAGLLLWAGSSFAQITSLEGYVKGADGKPLEKAVINIERTDIKGHYPTKTDKKGHYIYTGLPIGTYNITVLVDGKEADGIKGVKTSPGDPLVNNFDLSKKAAASSSVRDIQQQALQSGTITKEQEKALTPEQRAALQKQLDDEAKRRQKNKALNDAFNAGITAEEAKNYDEAIAKFTEASTLDATQVAVWNGLATSYIARAKTKTGADFDADTAQGIAAYEKAIALKPEDPSIHNNYALALAQAKKLPEAQAELEKSVALDPTTACKAYFNLGALELNAHQDDAAMEAFKKAVAGDAKCAEAYYYIGTGLMNKATVGSDGSVVYAPGTAEAFQQYLEVAPTGPHAEEAKAMLQALGTKIETNYADPNAKKKTTTPPKKKGGE
ncbi:MAG TPA: carboxypeptidase regulatory-like domain-containing protein [Verrucomicrobiae bacterium]|nr:carboxypeptidase regulatory-like domain-containing protein [Verrucomicrobiae bacterium]